jgi:hypothetical protein
MSLSESMSKMLGFWLQSNSSETMKRLSQVELAIGIQDTPALDAFGRLRTSEPYTIFDSKQLHDNQPLFFSQEALSGSGGSATYTNASASTTLSVTANTACNFVRQTKMRFNYQAGKSQYIKVTFTLGAPSSGVTKSVGYFDTDNGVFLSQSGAGVLSVNVRKNGSDNSVTQADWNVDKLDGTGASGITIDPTKSQILIIDLQYLSVGRVRFGFDIDGVLVYCHYFKHANNIVGAYMQTPNLPVRYQIIAGGTNSAGTIECICCSVESEGGVVRSGPSFSADRGITGFATGNNQSLHPVLSIRLKSTHLDSTVIPEAFSVISTSTSNFRWCLLMNPTIAGVDSASWTSISNSAVEFDVSRTSSNTLTGGLQLTSGYGTSTNSAIQGVFNQNLFLGATALGVRDEFIIAVQNLAGQSETYFSNIQWHELG